MPEHRMRKVTFGGANSLDNYLARPDHAVDWLRWGEEVAEVMTEYWKTIDTPFKNGCVYVRYRVEGS